MRNEYFLFLLYFDEIEPNLFDNDSLQPQLSALEIGVNTNSPYNYPDIIHYLEHEKFINGVYENHYKGQGLQEATSMELKGYLLTNPKGVDTLNEEIKQRSKAMTSKEIANKILEYCCKGNTGKIFTTRFVQRELLIPNDLFEGTLIKMRKEDGYAENYAGGMFSVSSTGCLFWNDGGYKKELEYIYKNEVYNIGNVGTFKQRFF